MFWAGIAGQLRATAPCVAMPPRILLNSRTILIWGRNPIVTNIHMLPC